MDALAANIWVSQRDREIAARLGRERSSAMAENNTFEAIMREISQGLTGNPEADMKYLQEQGDKYKDHEYGKEILRACGRMMYELIPDEKKAELNKILEKDNKGIDAALEEIRFNIYKKDYDKVLKLMESTVEEHEKSKMYVDDAMSAVCQGSCQ